ncbi:MULTISPECIES: zinc-dependent alcohol dehydrogenase family protein [unclassified Streptomyces]|uniref:zinc-dependent alcohol dehydrogenase family protein n=1 Tax=unclassified Streptomyces TaxID=2593676 RepID=UPI0006F9A9D9|nr:MULTISPECIES: zinc-dependent alcohol dehydrogenase family protein [unclassified Streptomyces]KQX53560.1 NADPH:quinone reductase [Streptomyces sp. Root1304]KRA90478.1 NADPH:quinone reductase [Streptomyces sp. Root66D1]
MTKHTTTGGTTRAVLFHELGGPEVLTVEEVPLPDPGPGEVLVRVEAIGLNRAEALFRAGTYYYRPTLPGSRLGYEAAGTVEAVGAGVTAYAPGDPVMAAANFDFGAHGVYAERVVLPEEYLVARPEGVDAVTAAAVWLTYFTAYGGMVLTGGLGAGDHVVITGASSGVGTAAVQIALRAGAVPIAVTRGEGKRKVLRDLGAPHVVVTDSEDLTGEVRRITGGAGADLVFDPVGGPGFARLGDALRPGGTAVLYGWLDPRPVALSANWPQTVHTYANGALARTAEGRRRAAGYIGSGLRDGSLAPVIAETFEGLERIADAHRLMESNTHVGKIVVRVGA